MYRNLRCASFWYACAAELARDGDNANALTAIEIANQTACRAVENLIGFRATQDPVPFERAGAPLPRPESALLERGGLSVPFQSHGRGPAGVDEPGSAGCPTHSRTTRR